MKSNFHRKAKWVILLIYLIGFLPYSAESSNSGVEYKHLSRHIRNQAELTNILTNESFVSSLYIVVNDSWQTIDFSQSNVNIKVRELIFVNIKNGVNMISGSEIFCREQIKKDSTWELNVQYIFRNEDDIEETHNILELNSKWPKLYQLLIFGYDSLSVTNQISANKIEFSNVLKLSRESFKNLYFNDLSFVYDVKKNGNIVDYIDFQFPKTEVYKNDSIRYYFSSRYLIYPLHYQIKVGFVDSVSFDYFLKIITPTFLATVNNRILFMELNKSSHNNPFELKFKREQFEPYQMKKQTNIICNNFLKENHRFLITEINKVDYFKCSYLVFERNILCKDLKLFDKRKKLSIRLSDTPRIKGLTIRLCLMNHKNVSINNIPPK